MKVEVVHTTNPVLSASTTCRGASQENSLMKLMEMPDLAAL